MKIGVVAGSFSLVVGGGGGDGMGEEMADEGGRAAVANVDRFGGGCGMGDCRERLWWRAWRMYGVVNVSVNEVGVDDGEGRWLMLS